MGSSGTESIHRGFICVILAALLWAAAGSAAKYLFLSGMSPAQLVQLRTTIGSVVLALWLGSRHPASLRVAPGDLWKIGLLGVSIAATQFTYYFAISKIQVAAAILLQYQAPVFVALFALIFARERLTPVIVAALSGALIGCYLLVGAYKLDLLHMNREGIAGGLASALCFAWYSVSSSYAMRRYTSWAVVFYSFLGAAVIWNLFHPPLEAFSQPGSAWEWWWVIFISIFGTVFAFWFYTTGIRLIGPTRASITATLEPITAGLISYLFLKESLEPLQIGGALIVIAAVVSLQIGRRAPARKD
jgi:drug/metabolite transporter (DMT)-like permease